MPLALRIGRSSHLRRRCLGISCRRCPACIPLLSEQSLTCVAQHVEEDRACQSLVPKLRARMVAAHVVLAWHLPRLT